jgi:hypothetical protein
MHVNIVLLTEAATSLSLSGSIHVVTKDAKLSLGLPFNTKSSFMIWQAASLGLNSLAF